VRRSPAQASYEIKAVSFPGDPTDKNEIRGTNGTQRLHGLAPVAGFGNLETSH
jgi:hypothetical protein